MSRCVRFPFVEVRFLGTNLQKNTSQRFVWRLASLPFPFGEVTSHSRGDSDVDRSSHVLKEKPTGRTGSHRMNTRVTSPRVARFKALQGVSLPLVPSPLAGAASGYTGNASDEAGGFCASEVSSVSVALCAAASDKKFREMSIEHLSTVSTSGDPGFGFRGSI